MAKTLEVLENLEKNLQKENRNLEEYQRELSRLKQSLIGEWQKMQRSIETNIKTQNNKMLKEVEQRLKDIDWELERCRVKKNWKWAIWGGIAAIAAILALLKAELTQKMMIELISKIIGG